MRRTVLVVGVVAIAAVAAGSVYGLRTSREVPPITPTAGLEVAAGDLVLGEVWETDQHVHTLTITNRRPTAVEIVDVAGSCTCARIEPRRFTLPPGGSQAVQVTLNLLPPAGSSMKETSQPFAVAVWADVKPAEGYAGRQQWQVAGRVRTAVVLPAAIDFGKRSEFERPVRPVTVRVPVASPAVTVSALAPPGKFAVAIQRADGDGKTYELTVTPAPDLPVGRHEGSVLVTATRPDGTRLPDRQVPVMLEVAPDVEAIPAAVEFGCRDVGAEVSEAVTLRSLSGRPFTVERVAAEGDGLTVDSTDRTYVVRRRVTGGPWEGRVRFTVRPSGGQTVELVVPIRMHGFAGG